VTRRSIARSIERLALIAPDRVAVIADEGTLTTTQLHRQSNSLARDFKARGVQRNDLVSVVLPNGLDFVVACAAIWKLGATPQPLSAKLPLADQRAIVTLAESSLVVGAEPGTFGETACIPVGHCPQGDVGDLDDAWGDSWKAPTSSGSTGRPKIIRAAAPALLDPTQPVAAFIPLEARQLVSGPMAHSATFTYAFRGLMTGHTLVILPRFDERRVLDAIREYSIDWLLLVPTMMHRIRRLPADVRDAADVSSVRTMIHLGAPCADDLKRFYLDWFGPERVIEVYAGTESSGITMIRGDEWLGHPGSVGRPTGGSQYRVERSDGSLCGAGEVGEIWMTRGAGATYTYLGAPDRRVDGWDTLGDLGYLDADGYLFVLDRKDDLIITGGVNVYPAEVERALEAHPLVRSAVVYGVADSDLGQRVEAHVDVDHSDIDAEELIAWVRLHLDPEKRPRSIHLVHTPVRNDAGKTHRAAWGVTPDPTR
jgi:bile acid-coenzyme A ligase